MKRLIFIVVTAVVCLGMLFVLFRGPKDTVYQGKPLSFWLKQAEVAAHRNQPGNLAVRHYGKDAEEMLNALLTARDTSIGMKVQQLLAKQKLIKFHFQPAGELNWRGLHGCSLLGAKVPGTVPALVALVNRPIAPFRYRGAGYEMPLYTLSVMGPKGIEALIRELDNKNPGIRREAARLLATAPGAATPEVVAALQKCLADPDRGLQAVAAQSLTLNEAYREQNIPAFATNWIKAPEVADSNPANVWDVNKGLSLLATSGVEAQSTLEDLFGGRHAHFDADDTGCNTFANRSEGFAHFVEWATPQPVTLGAFSFTAIHDPAEGKFQRALRSFRLYARAGSKDEYKLIYSEELTVPYGEGRESSMLFMFRNLAAPVVASQFRAEFVQHGNGMYDGPRVVRLCGFTPKLNWPMIEMSLQNQTPEIQDETRIFLHKPKD